MSRGLLLILWGWMVIWSVLSGRLDLLLRGVFHSLVGVSGVVLVAAGILLVIRHRRRREATRWPWLISAALGCLVLLIPPNPSFSDLASNRPQGLPEPAELAFVLPPEQRSLTEWVRLLRSQPDPQLAAQGLNLLMNAPSKTSQVSDGAQNIDLGALISQLSHTTSVN